MRFAANLSMMFTDLPLLERIQCAKQLGFQGVEVQFPYAASVADWQQALKDAQLPLVLINLPAGDFMQGGPGLASHPERVTEFKEAAMQALDYVDALQPSVLNVLAGRVAPGHTQAACLQQLVDNLNWLQKQLGTRPLHLTCEPINNLDQPGYLIPRPSDWAALASRLDHPGLKLQLDIYHAAQMQQAISDCMTRYAKDLVHIQFADHPGRGHPGTGQLNWEALLTQLKSQGYRGWLAAEFNASSKDRFDWLEAWQTKLS